MFVRSDTDMRFCIHCCLFLPMFMSFCDCPMRKTSGSSSKVVLCRFLNKTAQTDSKSLQNRKKEREEWRSTLWCRKKTHQRVLFCCRKISMPGSRRNRSRITAALEKCMGLYDDCSFWSSIVWWSIKFQKLSLGLVWLSRALYASLEKDISPQMPCWYKTKSQAQYNSCTVRCT